MMMTDILKHFPNLSEKQKEQFEALYPLYEEWNTKINVVSRKDFEHLYERHVLHSLAIAKVMPFAAGSDILDLGTGGGFPGIPLAILFPDVNFLLVDSIGKKILVVNEVAQAIGLKNVKAIHGRVEDVKNQKFDFIVSRAVAQLSELIRWSRKHLKNKHINALPNGWLLLKGGNLREEINVVAKYEYVAKHPIQKYFKNEFFEEKYVVYVQG